MSPAFDLDLHSATWHKSSYSDSQGGECLEVAQDFPGAAIWRKSTHSDKLNDACLEVADDIPGLVPVRDSKAGAEGPALVFRAPAWAAFVGAVRGDGLGVTSR